MDKNILEPREERLGWQVVGRSNEKTILTPFAQLSYNRTCYGHDVMQNFKGNYGR